MAQTIKLKRSATQGAVPSTSDLALGELAVNTYDGKIYIKKDTGTESIVEVGASGSNADTVDNLHASQFVRSDADDEKTGHLKLRNNAWLWTQYSSAHDEVRINANTSGGLDVYNQTDSAFANIQAGSFQISGTGTITGTTFNNWNTAYGWGNHASAGYLTGNQTITLSGDVSGSGTTSINVTVADDSHNHIISNVDGLQSALDAKLASSSYTASDVLTKIKTVDGSGSGLDADTVDGLQASSFLRSDVNDTKSGNLVLQTSGAVTNSTTGLLFEVGGTYNDGRYRTRFRKQDVGGGIPLYIDQSSGTANSYTAQARFGTYSGNNYEFEVYGDINATGNIYDGGNAVWHAGNDGSGSGLDADTVDGIQGGSLLRSDADDTASGTITMQSKPIKYRADGNYGFTFCYFQNNTGSSNYGLIYHSGSSMIYGTSSDYRLKENVVPLEGASERVKLLPVKRFNFIDDPSRTVDGFLAHELQEHLPEAVAGEKDGLDENGNPFYQAVDQSKLTPLLTAALQEALAKIEELEQRIENLENN
jgi:hypothetical protein